MRSLTASGDFVQIGTAAAPGYADKQVQNGTAYYYKVQAVNANGPSLSSLVANATPLATLPPAAPGGLVAAGQDTAVALSWTSSVGATGYRVHRSTTPGSGFVQVGAPSATAFTDTTVTNETAYYYTVQAANANGVSAQSVEISVKPRLSVPTNLVAGSTSETQVYLTWSDPNSTEDGYKVERKAAGGEYSLVATLGANTTGYNDTGLAASTSYNFRVFAYNSLGVSGMSNELNATTQAPAAPSSMVASAVSASRINLTWADNSSNEEGFQIERKTGAGGTYAVIATLTQGANSYGDTGLTATTQYYYRVRSYNAAGHSSYGNEANATTQMLPSAAPTNLVATAVSKTQINLTWIDNASTETGYKVERKDGATGTYTVIATLGVGVASYNNTGLAASTQYFYRVFAYNAGGDSAMSNEANTTTLPEAPSGLGASQVGASTINLVWADNSTGEAGFKIERRTGAGQYAVVGSVGPGISAFEDTGLTAMPIS